MTFPAGHLEAMCYLVFSQSGQTDIAELKIKNSNNKNDYYTETLRNVETIT